MPRPPAAVSLTYLLQDEIEANALLPVNVGVPQAWQLLRVPPVHLHLHLGLSLCWLWARAGVSVCKDRQAAQPCAPISSFATQNPPLLWEPLFPCSHE